MLKQAMIHEANGDVADALALYKGIEADYKTSREGNGIEKYIARARKRIVWLQKILTSPILIRKKFPMPKVYPLVLLFLSGIEIIT